MKKFLFLLLLSVGLYAQQSVKTIPNMHNSFEAFNGVLVGSTAGTYSSSFLIGTSIGAFTVFVTGDTAGVTLAANQSDSCLTVGFMIKDMVSNKWSTYYTSTSNLYTLIDTVNRAYINTDGSVTKHLTPAETTGWAVGDSAKLWLGIGVGDSLNLEVTVIGE